jgi:hypothetical protein
MTKKQHLSGGWEQRQQVFPQPAKSLIAHTALWLQGIEQSMREKAKKNFINFIWS